MIYTIQLDLNIEGDEVIEDCFITDTLQGFLQDESWEASNIHVVKVTK